MYTKPLAGESVAEVSPALAAEWHPTLNGDLTPADVLPGSNARVWWRCSSCGYEWATQVNSRARRGSGCRKCWHVRRGVLRSTPKPGRSFADLYPNVAAEWHPTRNGDLKPTYVKPASNKRVWWQCSLGHEWSVPPCDRRRGERCPECAKVQRQLKRSTPKPGRSLADLYPEVAVDWHPTLNAPLTASDVNPGSKTRRWWQCSTCGHEWETDPDHRTRGRRGCPKCAIERQRRTSSTPKAGESLAEKNPEVAAEWHPTRNESLTPFDVRPRGKASVWWRCSFGHEWKAKVAPRAVGIGCPRCNIIGVSERETRLKFELAAAGLPVAIDHPPIEVGGARRPVKADIAIPELRLAVEYDGWYYHRNKVNADRAQTAALESAGWTVVRVREQPLPSLGGHELFVSPTEPIKCLTLKVLRGLADLHYRASKYRDYQRDSELWAVPEANAALNKYRARSLATEHPRIAKQFHPVRNGSIGPDAVPTGSNTRFWWKCDVCGHEWRQTVVARIAGRGCPPCGVQRRTLKRAEPLPGQSFADLYPQRAQEWHPTRNGELTANDVRPASNKVVWWQCARGHEWEARVASRRQFGPCWECRAIERSRAVGRGAGRPHDSK
jgi:predicted  nucleic acid-binding Zn-ribbon protein